MSRPVDAEAGQHGYIRWAIEVGDPRQLRLSLGLSSETPFRLVKDMLGWLSRQRDVTAPDVQSRASELRLLDWLASGASVDTLVSGLRQLRSSGLLPAALALL